MIAMKSSAAMDRASLWRVKSESALDSDEKTFPHSKTISHTELCEEISQLRKICSCEFNEVNVDEYIQQKNPHAGFPLSMPVRYSLSVKDL